MGKEKTNRGRSAKDVAEGIFVDFQKQFVNEFSEVLKFLPQEEKRFLLFYLNAPKKLPTDSLEDFVLTHHFLVEPYVRWDKIKKALKGLNIDEKRAWTIVFVLKPLPLEKELFPNKNLLYKVIKSVEKRTCDFCSKQIKQISPLVKQLENLYHTAPERRVSFPPTIDSLKRDIEVYRELIKKVSDRERAFRQSFRIDKDLKKSPQKHIYWNVTVSRGIRMLNQYCHSNRCQHNCKITHETAIRKTAELLKILYPQVWKENISTIANRIKQKDYRHLSK
jgi:hypothetical protein